MKIRDEKMPFGDEDMHVPKKGKHIINLTPHPIKFIIGSGMLAGIIEIAPELTPARLEETTRTTGTVTSGDIVIPVISKSMGRIIDLLEPQENTIYVVSLPVMLAAKRRDVFAIGETIRDAKGNVIAAKSLAAAY